MDAPSPHDPQPTPSTGRVEADLAKWEALRDELTQLNAQLEYLKLMLQLGVFRA